METGNSILERFTVIPDVYFPCRSTSTGADTVLQKAGSAAYRITSTSCITISQPSGLDLYQSLESSARYA